MATITPTYPVESVDLQPPMSVSSHIFGDIFIHDQIVEYSVTGYAEDLSSMDLTMTYAVDDGLNYVSDVANTYYYAGDYADFNTNITIGGDSAPVDPTKGIQYWG